MREHMAELRLAAWTNKEHYQKASDVKCCSVALIFFNQGKCQIDTCGNSGGGVDGTVLQKDGFWADYRTREFTRQLVTELPVRHHLFSIDEAGRSK